MCLNTVSNGFSLDFVALREKNEQTAYLDHSIKMLDAALRLHSFSGNSNWQNSCSGGFGHVSSFFYKLYRGFKKNLCYCLNRQDEGPRIPNTTWWGSGDMVVRIDYFLRVVIDWHVANTVLLLHWLFTSLSLWWLFQVVARGFYRYNGSRFKQMALFTIERLSSH